MPRSTQTTELSQQFEEELRSNILPFWMKYTMDYEHGGFFGAVTNAGKARNNVERSAVLCGRILWTFSTAATLYNDASYLKAADWAFDALSTNFWDKQYNGIYWSIDRFGQPVQDKKHTYAQAFAIYGLAAYYQTSKKNKSLEIAQQLFELIELHTYDAVNGGNIECLARDWSRLKDMRLSDKDINSAKSMNTLLHLMESYAALLSVWPNEKLVIKLDGLIRIFLSRIIDKNSGHLRLFFDEQWNSLLDHISHGHEIETSWLFLESAKILGDAELTKRAREISATMAQVVYDESLNSDGSMIYETGTKGYKILTRQWWTHAEAVVGFYNAYQESGKTHFAEASERVWKFIRDHFIDRKKGDWFKHLKEDGTPILSQDKAGPWECPYHHARMCFEMIKRLNQ